MKIKRQGFIQALVLVLVSYSITYSQNHALDFNDEDFVWIAANDRWDEIHEEFSLEVMIVTGISVENRSALISNYYPEQGELIFGLNESGQMWLRLNGVDYETNQDDLRDGECHHLSVTISPSEIVFYTDGSHVDDFSPQATTEIPEDRWFTLARYFEEGSDPYQYTGIIDEPRVWDKVLTQTEIEGDMFSKITSIPAELYAYLPLDEGDGEGVTMSANHGFACLGESNSNTSNNPEWVENDCFLVEGSDPGAGKKNKLGSTNINCVPSDDCELVCNGGFEQVDPILLIAPTTPFAATFFPTAAWSNFMGYTDIAGWLTRKGDPEIFVRNGVGDIPNWVGHPTWDWPATGNDVIASIQTWYGFYFNQNWDWTEAIQNQLNQPLTPGGTYDLSFKISVSPRFSGDPLHDEYIDIDLYDALGNKHSLGQFIIPHSTTGNNGYYSFNHTFTVPANVTGLEKLSIGNNNHDPSGTLVKPSTGSRLYSSIDDVSLQMSPAPFSTYEIKSTNGRALAEGIVNKGDNTYVTGWFTTDMTIPGYGTYTTTTYDSKAFVVKYNCYDVEWVRIFGTSASTNTAHSICLDDNDDLLVVGRCALNAGFGVGFTASTAGEYIVRLDGVTGNTLDLNVFSTNVQTSFQHVACDRTDGQVFVSGLFNNTLNLGGCATCVQTVTSSHTFMAGFNTNLSADWINDLGVGISSMPISVYPTGSGTGGNLTTIFNSAIDKIEFRRLGHNGSTLATDALSSTGTVIVKDVSKAFGSGTAVAGEFTGTLNALNPITSSGTISGFYMNFVPTSGFPASINAVKSTGYATCEAIFYSGQVHVSGIMQGSGTFGGTNFNETHKQAYIAKHGTGDIEFTSNGVSPSLEITDMAKSSHSRFGLIGQYFSQMEFNPGKTISTLGGGTESFVSFVTMTDGFLKTNHEDVWRTNDDLTGKEDLHVFPNPVRNTLGLSVLNSDEILESVDYRILDMTGKQYLTGYSTGKVDVSRLPTGMYIIAVDVNNKVIYKRFSKVDF